MQGIFGKCYLRWSRQRDIVILILLMRKLSPKEVKGQTISNFSTSVSHFQVCFLHLNIALKTNISQAHC